MQRVTYRRKKGLACQSVVMPRVLKKLNESHDQSRRCRLVSEAGHMYEVLDYSYTFVVNMEQMTCDCRKWDIGGIPCRHAWVVINHNRQDGENFISVNHTKDAYLRAYDMLILPVPQSRFWPDDLTNDECSPPDVLRPPGRPPASRIKHPSEGSKRRKVPISKTRRKPKCSLCGVRGHNARKCPGLVSLNIIQLYYCSLQFIVTDINHSLVLLFSSKQILKMSPLRYRTMAMTNKLE